CLAARHALERTSENDGFARQGRLGRHLTGEWLDSHFREQVIDGADVVWLGEEVDQCVDDGLADALDVIDLAVGFAAVAALYRRLDSGAEGLPGVIGVGKVARRRFADVPDAEREDEAVEWHAAPRLDGLEQFLD